MDKEITTDMVPMFCFYLISLASSSSYGETVAYLHPADME